MQLRLLLLALLFMGVGCSTEPIVADDQPSATEPAESIYTTFVINVHDWTQPEESIATVGRIIDLHEQYKLPVDLYLTDGIVQVYQKQAPDLMKRMAESSYVAVSYHLRPPTPYYAGFHDEWFDGLSDAALKTELQKYETHEMSLTTGKPTDNPGGYAYLKTLIGYPPYVVVQAAGADRIDKTLAEIYKEMGASFTLRHGPPTALGAKANGLYLRPEDLEVKAYEKKTAIPVENMFADALEKLPSERPAFLNLKWHENNFYSSGTAWVGIYYEDGTERSDAFDPPYDLSLGSTTQWAKTDEEQKVQWERYEGMLKYIQAHPETYTPVNAKNILDLE